MPTVSLTNFSLVHMMESCIDFYNEMSQLEYVCKSLGVTALITTKYHAEYAGEGVEYSWGGAKNAYRRLPIRAKTGKANFENLLDRCISRDLLTTDLIRKYSKRARGYMLAYKTLEMKEKECDSTEQITHLKIENMKKVIKSHRSAIDFDKKFI